MPAPSSESVETAHDRPPYYQHVVVRGPPYDRGLSHGEQAREKIRKNVAYYKQPGKLVPW